MNTATLYLFYKLNPQFIGLCFSCTNEFASIAKAESIVEGYTLETLFKKIHNFLRAFKISSM